MIQASDSVGPRWVLHRLLHAIICYIVTKQSLYSCYSFLYSYRIALYSFYSSDLKIQGAVTAKVAVLDVVRRNLAQPARQRFYWFNWTWAYSWQKKTSFHAVPGMVYSMFGQTASLRHSSPQFVIVREKQFCAYPPYPIEKWRHEEKDETDGTVNNFKANWTNQTDTMIWYASKSCNHGLSKTCQWNRKQSSGN